MREKHEQMANQWNGLNEWTKQQILTSIMAYELDIIAISRFNKTITLITLYEPNMRRPQNRVYDFMPSSSNVSRPTMPKLAQNSDCDDSNRLQTKENCVTKRRWHFAVARFFLPIFLKCILFVKHSKSFLNILAFLLFGFFFSFWTFFSLHLLSESTPFHASVSLVLPIGHSIRFGIAFLTLQIGKVPQQLVETAGECKQYERINEEEFDNVDNHSAEWNLQRPQMRIDRKQVNQFNGRENVGSGK